MEPGQAGDPLKLGRYEITGQLGKGAMGVVYQASDPVIGRTVALKTVRKRDDISESQMEEYRTRFLREARAAGILNHPNIVTIYDAGEDEASGTSYIAMEHVSGATLDDALASGAAFPFEQAITIVAQVAAALDYAHRRGVIHRDVKPANIILSSDGSVKLADFGIARIESMELTRTGQTLGTPNYMSPEQLRGAHVDHRTDLFSLGIVLYRLLTGERPFQGDSATAVSYQIVHEEPPPPTSVRPELPDACDAIVRRVLAKDPKDRYDNGAELVTDLLVLAPVPGLAIGAPDSAEAQAVGAGRTAADRSSGRWSRSLVAAAGLAALPSPVEEATRVEEAALAPAMTESPPAERAALAVAPSTDRSEASTLDRSSPIIPAEIASWLPSLAGALLVVLSVTGVYRLTIMGQPRASDRVPVMEAEPHPAEAAPEGPAVVDLAPKTPEATPTATQSPEATPAPLAVAPTKVEEAKRNVGAGDLDAAMFLVGKALEEDPENEEAKLLEARIRELKAKATPAATPTEPAATPKPAPGIAATLLFQNEYSSGHLEVVLADGTSLLQVKLSLEKGRESAQVAKPFHVPKGKGPITVRLLVPDQKIDAEGTIDPPDVTTDVALEVKRKMLAASKLKLEWK